MDNDSKNDEKHTWAAFVAIALFSNSFVLFLQTISPEFPPPRLQYVLLQKESLPTIKKASPFSFFSPIYLLPQDLNLFPQKGKISYFLSSSLLCLNLPIKSNLPNFKFPSKTFQRESHLP